MPLPATTPDEPSDALQQARAKAQRTATAFRNVFGKGTGRSEEQRLVRSHLDKCADAGKNPFQFGQYKDGLETALAAAQRTGAQLLLDVIDRQIEISSKSKEPKPRPVAKR